MGLKDVSKVVANELAREDIREARQRPFVKDNPQKYKDIDTTPFTSKPADTTNHVGFKFNSSNPFHKHILNTLVNNGDDKDLVISERGVSIPKSLAYSEKYRQAFADSTVSSAGGEFRGEAAKVKPRKSTSTAQPTTRPAPPKILKPTASGKAVAPNRKPPAVVVDDLRSLFTGANVRVDPEVEARKKAEAAKAEEAERKARRKEAKRRLKED